MTIRHFRIFMEVAARESITKAAQSLYLSQPTVSVAIKEMEEHYGTPFFDRINKRLQITDAGKQMASYASHLLRIYDDMEKTFKNPDPRGTIRIGASLTAGTYYLPKLIKKFRALCPDIQIQTLVDSTNAIEKQLLDNSMDLAFTGGPVHSDFLSPTPVATDHYIAVCAPGHPLLSRSRVSCADLAAEGLLIRERTSSAASLILEAFRQNGCPTEPIFESVSMEALLEAAAEGLGVAILPSQFAAKAIDEKRLFPIAFSDFAMEYTIFLVYHKNKFISPGMRRFIQTAFEVINAKGGPSPLPPSS